MGKEDVHDQPCEYVPTRMSERDPYDVTSTFFSLFWSFGPFKLCFFLVFFLVVWFFWAYRPFLDWFFRIFSVLACFWLPMVEYLWLCVLISMITYLCICLLQCFYQYLPLLRLWNVSYLKLSSKIQTGPIAMLISYIVFIVCILHLSYPICK